MGRAAAPYWPLLMKRPLAMAYCDMTAAELERAIASGRLPCPAFKDERGVEWWSRAQIDQTLERVGGTDAPDWRAKARLYAQPES